MLAKINYITPERLVRKMEFKTIKLLFNIFEIHVGWKIPLLTILMERLT